MKIHGAATEADMVAAFLEAEFDSARWRKFVVHFLSLESAPSTIITAPNLADAAENARRIAVLGYRGYDSRTALFEGFPKDVQWEKARITREDCLDLKVLNEGDWIKWSMPNRRAEQAAETLARGNVRDAVASSIPAIIARLQAGEVLPPILLVGVTGQPELVILEGHGRVMAAILSGAPIELSALIGTSPRMSGWSRF